MKNKLLNQSLLILQLFINKMSLRMYMPAAFPSAKGILFGSMVILIFVFMSGKYIHSAIAWWQTSAGNIYINGDLDPQVPGGTYFSKVSGSGDSSGFIIFSGNLGGASYPGGGGETSLGSGSETPNSNVAWTYQDSVNAFINAAIPTGGFYDFFFQRIQPTEIFNQPRLNGSNINSCDSKICIRNGNLAIGNSVDINNGSYVFFITGDLIIDNNVTIDDIPGEDMITFVVENDIIVNNPVTTIEGIYIADRDILTTTNNQLTTNGMVIVQNDVILNISPSSPTVIFQYNPNILRNFPPSLRIEKTFFRNEVAP